MPQCTRGGYIIVLFMGCWRLIFQAIWMHCRLVSVSFLIQGRKKGVTGCISMCSKFTSFAFRSTVSSASLTLVVIPVKLLSSYENARLCGHGYKKSLPIRNKATVFLSSFTFFFYKTSAPYSRVQSGLLNCGLMLPSKIVRPVNVLWWEGNNIGERSARCYVRCQILQLFFSLSLFCKSRVSYVFTHCLIWVAFSVPPSKRSFTVIYLLTCLSA